MTRSLVMSRLTNLIKSLKKKHPDGQGWRSEYIHQATQRRLSQDVSQKLSDLIDQFIEYSSDRENYIGFYGELFESLDATDPRDFIVKYAKQSGFTESENEAHRFVDGLFAAEEVIEGNISAEASLAHYDVEQAEPPQEVDTGIDKFGEDEVLEVDGYSDEQEGKLHDFLHEQQSN